MPGNKDKKNRSKGPGQQRKRAKHGNYSIKPPKEAGPKGQEGELKFNYKTLRFEKVSSTPPSVGMLNRKQSVDDSNRLAVDHVNKEKSLSNVLVLTPCTVE